MTAGDTGRRRVKRQLQRGAVAVRRGHGREPARPRLVAVAHPRQQGLRRQRVRRRRLQPVAVGKQYRARRRGGGIARHVYRIGGYVLGRHVPGAIAEPQPLALADGMEPVAAVRAEQRAAGQFADRPGRLAQVSAHEGRIAQPAEEAEALAVPAVARRQAPLPRQRAHLLLAQPAEREAQAAELAAAQVGQEVALVLDRVHPAQQSAVPVRRRRQARVVPAGHGVVVGADALHERAELDRPVAQHVGTRRAPGAQGAQHVLHHRLLIFRLQRNHLQRHPQLAAHRAGVAQVLLPRAVAEERQFLLQPDLQVERGEPVAGLAQQGQRQRAVDPAREQHRDALAPRGRSHHGPRRW